VNAWQVTRQIKYILTQRTWEGTGSVVFPSGSVKATEAMGEKVKRTGIRMPFALVAPGAAQADPEHNEEPDLLRRDFRVSVMTMTPGDHVGERPLIGGNIPDTSKSEGRGILEIEEEVLAAIKYAATDLGVVIEYKASGVAMPLLDADLGYILSQDHMFQAWLTAARFYHPAINFVATGGAGQVSLSWGVPPDRFDRYRMVLRRAAGATAPTSISGGTGVTLASALATSVVDTVAAGTYSYALFATYDEKDGRPEGTPDTDQRVSEAVTKTSVVVT
jgi:hypothetical protein